MQASGSVQPAPVTVLPSSLNVRVRPVVARTDRLTKLSEGSWAIIGSPLSPAQPPSGGWHALPVA